MLLGPTRAERAGRRGGIRLVEGALYSSEGFILNKGAPALTVAARVNFWCEGEEGGSDDWLGSGESDRRFLGAGAGWGSGEVARKNRLE
jgi:hypothetical protein